MGPKRCPSYHRPLYTRASMACRAGETGVPNPNCLDPLGAKGTREYRPGRGTYRYVPLTVIRISETHDCLRPMLCSYSVTRLVVEDHAMAPAG